AGYSSAARVDPHGQAPFSTAEPPLLEAGAFPRAQATVRDAPPPAPFPTGPNSKAGGPNVPTIVNKGDDSLVFRPSVPRSAPQGSIFTTAVPQQKTQPPPAPLPLVEEDGPSLTPVP